MHLSAVLQAACVMDSSVLHALRICVITDRGYRALRTAATWQMKAVLVQPANFVAGQVRGEFRK